MRAVKGRYNGSSVVLDEPAPVNHEIAVTVQFPDEGNGAVAEELLRQDGLGIVPAPGLPPIPSPAEWQQRMAMLESVLDEWAADESGYDEEAWPELKAALERNRADSGDYRKLFRE